MLLLLLQLTRSAAAVVLLKVVVVVVIVVVIGIDVVQGTSGIVSDGGSDALLLLGLRLEAVGAALNYCRM